MLRMYCRCIVLSVFALMLGGCAADSVVTPPADSDDCTYGEMSNGGLPVLQPTSTAVIGATGGTLTSPSGRITLSVPPGALSSDKEFRMLQMNNSAPLGVGLGVYLLFTGAKIQLNAPATVTFRYDEWELEGTVASALGLAHQNLDDRTWTAVGVTRDPNNSALSMAINEIDNINSFAMYTAFAMRSDDSPVVDPGGTYSATMYTQPKIAQLDTLRPGGSVRLCLPIASTAALEPRVEIGASGGGGGSAGAGGGSASHSGGTATYHAPASVPDNPWLAMLVRWPSGYHWGTVEVYNHVWIGGVIEFYLDGKFYSYPVMPPIAYSSLSTGRTVVSGGVVSGVAGPGYISLSFKLVDVGSHAMQNTGDPATDDGLNVTIGDKTYDPYYYECVGNDTEFRLTDLGTVTVIVANRDRRYISGSFSGRIAALDGTKILCGAFEFDQWTVYPINGTFRCAWGTI